MFGSTKRSMRLAVAVILTACFASTFAAAGDAPPKKPAAKPAEAPTYTVKKEAFKVEVELKGVFEAESMTRVSIVPEAWTELRFTKVVPHGTLVKKGDTLIWFDLENVDKEIKSAEAGLKTLEITYSLAKADLARSEKSSPLDIAAAKRTKRIADEGAKYFKDITRPLSIKSANHSLKSSERMLSYVSEELRQLEKMYKADDLTEETEEIILQRARNNVERARFSVEKAKIAHAFAINVEIPRKDEMMKDKIVRDELAYAAAMDSLPKNLEKKKLDFKKQTRDREKAIERLDDLKKDRAAMTVKAPADGIVYYGRCVRGKWAKPDPITAAEAKGGVVRTRDVLMTIVRSRPMIVRATVGESKLKDVKAELEGTITPTADATLKIKGKITEVLPVPISDGVFAVTVSADLTREAAVLMPGMACKIKLVPYSKDDALTVPVKAVFTDDDDADYVYIEQKRGKPRKQMVTVGRRNAKKAEILKGVKADDVIMTTKPKD